MSKHTPGPWLADNFLCDGDHALRIAMPDVRTMPGATIAVAQHNWSDAEFGERRISWKEAEANARLIAAAPAMLAALEFITEQFGDWLDGVEDPDRADTDAMEAARAVIAAARGEG